MLYAHHAATRADLAESTFQTIYRQATVKLQPVAGQADRFEPVVEVQTFRSDRREPQVSSTSEGISLFRLPGDETRTLCMMDYDQPEPADPWVPLGRDEDLEEKLGDAIRAKAGL